MTPEENIPLSEHTTFKIGGLARYFFRAKTVDDLNAALDFAEKKHLPFFVLGGGSNILASDEGFQGVIIKNELLGISFTEDGDDIEVVTGAGEPWDNFVEAVVGRGLYGLENLSGIPGTVGAAPVQNIGAYGVEVKETIVSVLALDGKTGALKTFNNSECFKAYRDSFFKTPKGKRFVIVSVTFRLKKRGILNLEYKDLQNKIFNFQFSRLPETGTVGQAIFNDKEKERRVKTFAPKDVRKAVLEIRRGKFPDLKTTGTAGSFFKNPIITEEHFIRLKKQFPDLPSFSVSNVNGQMSMVKLPLAWILDNICKLKGYQKEHVGLYERQPIVVVNTGAGSAEEVKTLAEETIRCVKEKTGIDIDWEVEKL